jgi:hypothetical protein
MSEFPWNLPEEWLPELPINRSLLGERYVILKASFRTRPQSKGEISAAVMVDHSNLSMFERGLLLQELIRFFGFGAEPVGVPGLPEPPEKDARNSFPVPPSTPLR